MTIDQARKWSKAWLRAMRIYAYAMTEAINTAHMLDTYYFMNKYRRAEERWRNALERVAAMHLAATTAAQGRS